LCGSVGLFRQVHHDRAGLEDGERRAAAHRVGVDDGGHAVVGRDLQIVGLELVATADVHRLDRVGDAGLFQQDDDLLAVAGGPEIQLYHGKSPRLKRARLAARQCEEDSTSLFHAPTKSG
jgi:hypothetical protein